MAASPNPPRLARLLTGFFLGGDAGEVIAGDLDQEFNEAIAQGVPVSAANRRYWRQALASIASVAAVRRHHKEQLVNSRPPFPLFRGFWLDLRSVGRVLRRSPGYAAVAILSLAIGIGANTAMVSVIRQLLLAPLPVERPNELRLVYWNPNSNEGIDISQIGSTGFKDASGFFLRSNYSYGEFAAMRERVKGHAELAGFNTVRQLTVAADGRVPLGGSGMLVSGNFFSTLRLPLAIGRGITEADDQSSAATVGVISFGLWSRLFGNAPDVLGKTIRVNGAPVEIVGVTAAPYRGLSPGGFSPLPDVHIAISQQPLISPEWGEPGESLFTAPNMYWVRAIARVDDAHAGAAADILRTTFQSIAAGNGLTPAQAARAVPVLLPAPRGYDSLRTTTTPPLRILTVVVGIVLLIACINVAGLMLARGVSRQKELTVRRALGASRARIMRELLMESVAISIAGGIAGLSLALIAAPVLRSILTAGLGTNDVGFALDWQVLATAGVIACTAGILAGLIPAIRFSRNDGSMLKDRGGIGAPKLLVGRALLALQIAVSLPLVAGAGLLLKTLHNLASIDVGFNPRDLVLFSLDPTLNGKAPARNAIVFPQLLARLEQIPGVSSATLIENALISNSESDSRLRAGDRVAQMFVNAVGPHYLETMGVPLVSGRPIDGNDVKGRPSAVVLNQTAVKTFFPELNAASVIGQRLRGSSREYEVVGVTADTKYEALRNAIPPTMLQSYQQRTMGTMTVIVRAAVPAGALRTAIERAVSEIDSSLPITKYKTQTEQINETIGKERVFVRLLTTFGGFALLLACVGLHGVTSYSVARRTGEIGIRLALGAQRSQVLWMILRQVVVLAALGLGMGLPLAYLAGPAVKSLLFGLEANDPMTLIGSGFVMVAVAIAAGIWPARRAAKMEALTALRSE